MIGTIIEGISLGLLLSVLVGPVFFMLIDTTITHGRRAALVTDVGILTSDALYVCLFYIGATDFLQPVLKSPLAGLVGGAVLAAFGLAYLLRKPPKQAQVRRAPIGLGFVKGFLANALTPSVFAFWLGTVTVAVREHADNPQVVLYLFAIALTTVFFVDILKIIGANWLRPRIKPSIITWFGRIAGAVFLLVGLVFIGRFFVV